MKFLENDQSINRAVEAAFRETRVIDMHTHLFAPRFGDLLLRGIDELLTYHYLVAETMRRVGTAYEAFWAMPKSAQADLVWKTLFVDRPPVSEACRGVITVLDRLGLDASCPDLDSHREFFSALDPEGHVDLVLKTAGIERAVMTNDPFDEAEAPSWAAPAAPADSRFTASLRLDALLNDWPGAMEKMKRAGYLVERDLGTVTRSEIRRFLETWTRRTGAAYLAASLPPDFAFPEKSPRATIIEHCVLPVCRAGKLPFALMVGVRKLLNPGLRLAGDSVGRSDIRAVENLCLGFPENRFMVTMLSRENQHELCVTARKFRNLLVFGCWWFLNNPVLIEEMTRMRLELLGTSFVPQHSDARILDQLVYKWAHSRSILARVAAEKYRDLAAAGRPVTEEEIRRDATDLLGGNFLSFAGC